MIKKFGFLVFAISVAVMLVSNVWAARITVNGTPVFDSGGFESDTLGADPSVATIGSYYIVDKSTGGDVFVTDASGGVTNPAANEGSQYYEFYKTASDTYSSMLGTLLQFSQSATTGDMISAEFAFCFDSVKTDVAGVPGNDTDGFAFFAFATGAATGGPSAPNRFWDKAQSYTGLMGQTPYYSSFDWTGAGTNDMCFINYNGSAYVQVTDADSNPFFVSADTWHDVTFDYTVGGTFTVTLDGVTSVAQTPAAGSSATDVVGLQVFSNGSDTSSGYYLDSVAEVPEPGTIALLITGLFGLLLWKRR